MIQWTTLESQLLELCMLSLCEAIGVSWRKKFCAEHLLL
jgi:hypothetical protein